ncbi:hypothetical protein SEVIR_5G131033v4 [Setaria viridis]
MSAASPCLDAAPVPWRREGRRGGPQTVWRRRCPGEEPNLELHAIRRGVRRRYLIQVGAASTNWRAAFGQKSKFVDSLISPTRSETSYFRERREYLLRKALMASSA